MLEALVAGALAGYAIAIPVGAIAVLIVDLGIRRGFRVAAAAGLGAATADGLYATLAMVGGAAAASLLAPIEGPLRIVAAVVLVGVGLRGLRAAARGSREATGGTARGAPGDAPARAPAGLRATYARFLALTLLNPHTVIYFAALILGLPALTPDASARVAFVVGAYVASASWQVLLAGIAAVAHHRLPGRFQVAVSLFGNVLILAFAIVIALDT